MNGWIIRGNNSSNWISCWNEWMFYLLKVGHNEEYNTVNKNKRTEIRRP